MTLAFACGLAAGAAVVVFARDTPVARKLLIWVHVRVASLRRWRRR